MASRKILVALTFVTVVVIHVNGNLRSGHRTDGDALLCHEEVGEKFSLINWVYNLEWECRLSSKFVITHVLAVNRDNNNSDGVDVRITEGGPGLNYVHLLFKKPFTCGVYYSIDVYEDLSGGLKRGHKEGRKGGKNVPQSVLAAIKQAEDNTF